MSKPSAVAAGHPGELGGEAHLVALAPDRAAYELVVAAVAEDVGGIEEMVSIAGMSGGGWCRSAVDVPWREHATPTTGCTRLGKTGTSSRVRANGIANTCAAPAQ
jgi:hypothetical protein